jgi:hypothetical protein
LQEATVIESDETVPADSVVQLAAIGIGNKAYKCNFKDPAVTGVPIILQINKSHLIQFH